jgi:hypothetical protein
VQLKSKYQAHEITLKNYFIQGICRKFKNLTCFEADLPFVFSIADILKIMSKLPNLTLFKLKCRLKEKMSTDLSKIINVDNKHKQV